MSNILNDLPENLKKQLKALQGMYQLIDNTDDIDQTLRNKLNELENKLVQDNIVPYIKDLLNPILSQIRVPVSISMNYEPKQGIKVEAPKMIHAMPASLIPPSPKNVPPSMQPIASASRIDILRRKYSNQTVHKTTNGVKTSIPATKAPATGLCIYLDLKNNIYIQRTSAAQTMADAIKYAMELKGSKTIYNFHIPHLNQHLIDNHTNPNYGGDFDLIDGYYVNTFSNTITKKRQLDKISDHFDLGWVVKIVK